ncbi:MAG: hypothetical protein OEY64_09605 [Nitrospinota bacterium]|nr:hypothetical protein [Nitrospinota bacterium]
MIHSKSKTQLRWFLPGSLAISFALFASLLLGGCASSGPAAENSVYSGTIYIAGTNGGHIAKASVVIDPSNTMNPITVTKLKRILVSDASIQQKKGEALAPNKTHVLHDVRLSPDNTKLFYSTIVADGTEGKNNGKAHAGYINLADNSRVDVTVDVNKEDPEAKIGIIYCGSGQTAEYHVPLTMSHPAYIDAIPKTKMVNGMDLMSGKDFKRTMIKDFRGSDDNYIFSHGSSSPDGKTLYVAVCRTEGGGGKKGDQIGAWDTYLLKMDDVVSGNVNSGSIISSGSLSGVTPSGGSMAFRSDWTPDGKMIFQAGVDRFVAFNAKDLKAEPIVNTEEIGGSKVAVENHGVMSTPDGKYAILSLRYRDSDGAVEDGGLQLLSIASGKTIGEPTSVCNSCHDEPVKGDRKLCGIDGALMVSNK